jgi:integrase
MAPTKGDFMETRNSKTGKPRYRSMITIEGKTFKSPWSHRKTDCNEWLAQKKAERRNFKLFGGCSLPQEKTFFGDFSQKWLERKIRPHSAPSTFQSYESLVRVHFIPHLGSKYLSDITHGDAADLIMKLKSLGHNNQGINHVMRVLKQILREAEREEVINKSPLTHFKPLKMTEEQMDFWNDDEINLFFKAVQGSQLFPVFATAVYTGMRRGELAGLKWDSVDFEGRRIRIQRIRDRYGLRDTTKTGKFRFVPINPSLYPILFGLWQNRTEETDFVFLDQAMNPIDAHHLNRQFDRLQKSVKGIKRIRFHDLRHTFASHFVMKGGSIYVLREVLGHADVKMTQRYAHLSPEHMRGVTDVLSFDAVKTQSNPNLTHEGLRLVTG